MNVESAPISTLQYMNKKVKNILSIIHVEKPLVYFEVASKIVNHREVNSSKIIEKRKKNEIVNIMSENPFTERIVVSPG